MARIQRFTSRVQADLACSMLKANGVDARVSSDDAGGLHPDIPYGIGGTVVVVPDEQLDEANALLDEDLGEALGRDLDEAAGEGHGDESEDRVSVTDRPRAAGRSTGLRIFTAIVVIGFVLLAASSVLELYRF